MARSVRCRGRRRARCWSVSRSLLRSAKVAHVAADVTIAASKRERRLEPGLDFPETGEIKRLLAAATTERQRALLLTAALTGLRASELRGLRWSDVDLKVGELHVRQRADRFLAPLARRSRKPGAAPCRSPLNWCQR